MKIENDRVAAGFPYYGVPLSVFPPKTKTPVGRTRGMQKRKESERIKHWFSII